MSQDLLQQLYRAIGPMIPLFAIFAIFYVLMILPIRKKQRALQALLANLKKGDRVITNGGIYGEVAALTDSTVVLKIADNVKVRIARSAITGLEGEAEKGGNS
ncbi:MAG TPA: preprotein translocase subunit YajC [Thermoanaerobaculia bacterium]|nr:preprotein translocase subunit YajC [Thermoanaerobaculia bacterium]